MSDSPNSPPLHVVAICLLPLVAVVASTVAAIEYVDRPAFDGVGLVVVALLFAALNFYGSFGRHLVWKWRAPAGSEYRHVSGFPVIGSLFVVLSVAFGFGALGTSLLALTALVFDTGGAPWFLASVWRHERRGKPRE